MKPDATCHLQNLTDMTLAGHGRLLRQLDPQPPAARRSTTLRSVGGDRRRRQMLAGIERREGVREQSPILVTSCLVPFYVERIFLSTSTESGPPIGVETGPLWAVGWVQGRAAANTLLSLSPWNGRWGSRGSAKAPSRVVMHRPAGARGSGGANALGHGAWGRSEALPRWWRSGQTLASD